MLSTLTATTSHLTSSLKGGIASFENNAAIIAQIQFPRNFSGLLPSPSAPGSFPPFNPPTMYELFLTAFVEDADLSAACAVLSGLCGMPAWESLSRVLYFQGVGRPSGISNQSSIERPLRKDVGIFWKDLHQSLSRQSFVLQARYEVQKDRDMGPQAQAADLDSTAGVLRFTDFPDAPNARPIVVQRKKVEIWEQKKLPSILRDNNYQYVIHDLA